MSDRLKILCSGNIAVDCYTDIKDRSLSEEFQKQVLVQRSETLFLGGKAMNFASAFSQCDVETWFHGSAGSDLFGKWAVRQADLRGINTELVVQSGYPTMTFRVDSTAQDTIPEPVYKNHASLHLPSGHLTNELLSSFDCVVLHATSAWDDLEELCSKLNHADTFVVFNPAPNFNIKSFVPFETADLIITNKLEAQKILSIAYNESNTANRNDYHLAHEISGLFNKPCIVTLGEKGVVAYDTEQSWHCPIRPSRLIDTVGAGDGFLGYAVSALLKAHPLDEALHIGQIAAGKICEQRGVYHSDLSYDRVLNEMATTSGPLPFNVKQGSSPNQHLRIK